MTYHDLINQWFERSTSEQDTFTKYIFLYIAFIAFLTQADRGVSDREKIESLKCDMDLEKYYAKLIKKDKTLKDVLKQLIKELRRDPIRNSTRLNDPYWIGRDGVISKLSNWSNLVEFWYRVRNNLFHGHKAPEFDRDERLVSYAFLTLFPLMKNFIEHDLCWEFD